MTPARTCFLFLICLVTASPPAIAQDAEPAPIRLTAEQTLEDVQLAIDAVEAGVPNLYWHQSLAEWEQAKAEALARIDAVEDPIGVWAILAPLMSHVGEGHLSVFPGRDTLDHERDTASILPLDLHWNENGVFVSGTHGDAGDIPVGARLLSINGEDFNALFDELMSVTPHDGDIRTSAMRENAGERYAVQRRRLRGDEAAFVIRYEVEGTVSERTVSAVPLAGRPKLPDRERALPSLEWLEPDMAYLVVSTFSNAPYREAKTTFRATMQAAFEELRRGQATRLILDLRDNGGGAEPNESTLFAFLVAEPLHKYEAVEARGRDLSVTSLSGEVFERRIFDEDDINFQRPLEGGRLTRINAPPFGLMSHWEEEKPVFTGQLVVLAGGYTFSGGAELASMLHHAGRGVFVGEEIAGAHEGNTSGYSWRIILPNSKLRLNVPLLQFRFNWPGLPQSRGVRPDCPVPPLVSEIGIQRDRAWRVARAVAQQDWTRPTDAVCPDLD